MRFAHGPPKATGNTGLHGIGVLPLAALLMTDDADPLRVLGADLRALQLRRAWLAGARHAVAFVERVTPTLLETVDLLRAEGMTVDIARSVSDAAEFIHPDEEVLLLPARHIIAPAQMMALAESPAPHLLCVRDEANNAAFELIDPTARWTGFAKINGGLVRRTAAMVGDWDLASTLLRRAVQEGATRTTLTPDEQARDLRTLTSVLDAHRVGRALVGETPHERAGWGTHWLLAPLARPLGRLLGDAGLEGRWVTLMGFMLFAIAAAAALAGWIVASLCVLLMAQMVDLAGAIVTRAGAAGDPYGRWRFPVRAVAASAVVLAMGTTLMLRTGQWGCVLLAGTAIVTTWLGAQLIRDDERAARWRSDPPGHALIGIFGFIAGGPVIALGLAAAHSIASLIWAQRTLLKRLASS